MEWLELLDFGAEGCRFQSQPGFDLKCLTVQPAMNGYLISVVESSRQSKERIGNCLSYEPGREKTGLRGFRPGRHKPGCIATEDG